MTGTTASWFFWADWRSDPGVRACGLAARGLWMDMLSLMAESEPVGVLTLPNGSVIDDGAVLARLVGADPKEVMGLLAELENHGVFSRRNSDKAIYSRRMIRDAKAHRARVQGGRRGGRSSRDGNKGIFASPDIGSDAGSPLGSGASSALGSDIGSGLSSPPWRARAHDLSPKPSKPNEGSSLAAQPALNAAREANGNGVAGRASLRHDPEWVDQLTDRLLDVAGLRDQAAASTSLLDVSPIIRLIDQGYDLETDVVPVIRGRAKPHVRRWDYFVEAIVEARTKAAAIAPASAKPSARSTLAEREHSEWDARLTVYERSGNWGAHWPTRDRSQVPGWAWDRFAELDAKRASNGAVAAATSAA